MALHKGSFLLLSRSPLLHPPLSLEIICGHSDTVATVTLLPGPEGVTVSGDICNAVVYKLIYHPKKLCAKLQICGTQVLNQGLGPDCHVLPFYKLICNLIRGDAQMTSALGGSGGGVTQNLTEGREVA